MHKRVMAHSPDGWEWLQETYWYIQDRWLPSLRYDAAQHKLNWQVYQSLWHIMGYRYGYFFGVATIMSYPAGQPIPANGENSNRVHMTLTGTINLAGTVELTFTPQTGNGEERISNRIVMPGRIIEMNAQRTIEIQTTTGTGDSLSAHWAYMFQTHPGDDSWEQLPGTGMSVPGIHGRCGSTLLVKALDFPDTTSVKFYWSVP